VGSEVNGAQEQLAIGTEGSGLISIVVGTNITKSVSTIDGSAVLSFLDGINHADNPKVGGQAVNAPWKLANIDSFSAGGALKEGSAAHRFAIAL
jgi:hypothetical protein